MKKTSLFIVIVTFLASIFLVSFFGAQVIDEQFKSYIRKVEITTFTDKLPNDGVKYYNFEYKDGGDNFINIDYEVTFSREGVSEEGLIEFEIISGNSTFEQDGVMYDMAVLQGRGNVLYFNAPCAVTVELRSSVKDGSGCSDTCIYRCI